MRPRYLLTLSLALLLGCPAHSPTVTGRNTTPKPKATAKASSGGTPAPTLFTPRILGADAVAVSITGTVKLISDGGGGIISNNSGGIISNNSSGIVSNNAGSLRLLAATAPEARLADATIAFFDAAGQQIVDAAGHPITAHTDQTGAYSFQAKLPPESLVARVKLWNGGELSALLVKGPAGQRTLDLDTAATLGATYVLDQFVKGSRDVLARLPLAEAEALHVDLEASRGLLGAKLTYTTAGLLEATTALRRDAKVVDDRLTRIKDLLLVGQANLGEGRPADQVALAFPGGLTGDAAGNLYVSEFGGSRVRRIGTDGRISRWVGGLSTSQRREGARLEVGLDTPSGLVMAPDGTLYIADPLNGRVFAVKNDQVRIIAGTGERKHGDLGGPALSTALLSPFALALGPDGRLYIAERSTLLTPGRMLVLGLDGLLTAADSPPLKNHGSEFSGMTFAPDGTMWAIDVGQAGAELWHRTAAGWVTVASGLAVTDLAGLAVLPDGDIIVAEERKGRLIRVHAADGTQTIIGGDGELGFRGEGVPSREARFNGPAQLWLSPTGTLYLTDLGNGLVRSIAPPLDGSGLVRTVAGARGATQQGDALSIAINTPGGMTLDAAGRLVFTEGGSGTVKRLENGALTLLAGTTKGFGGDGGPATGAQLFAPTGISRIGDDYYVLDASNDPRIRKIAADGTISTVVGTGLRGDSPTGTVKGTDCMMRFPVTCAVSPDGLLYWADAENSQVLRLRADGFVEVVAGDGQQAASAGVDPETQGDGGPARSARLSRPLGLAFDSQGDLFVADTGNFRVRRISGLSTATPRIDAFVGLPIFKALQWLTEGKVVSEPTPAADVLLVGPTGLAIDADDTLYISEIGTAKISSLLGEGGLAALLDDVPPRGAKIRRVTGLRAGHPMATTIAGDGTTRLNDPGSDDSLLAPIILLIDPARGLFIADTSNNQIKLLPKGSF